MTKEKIEASLLLESTLTRRAMLKSSLFVCMAIAAGGISCSRSPREYIRKSEKCWIGAPEEYFFPLQMAREPSILIMRDDNGWYALDGRCSFDGCDLSFNGKMLLCPCCRSIFDIDGSILSLPAKNTLRYWRMSFEADSLIVFAGDTVPPSTRFTTPELETRFKKLQEEFKDRGLLAITKPDLDLIEPSKRKTKTTKLIADTDLEEASLNKIKKRP